MQSFLLEEDRQTLGFVNPVVEPDDGDIFEPERSIYGV